MAVAGLHNVSVSRQWGNQDRPRTQASSILQMWRDLEGEHLVSHPQVRFGEIPNGIDNGVSLEDATEIENEHEDNDNSSSLEQSTDFGEVERERVRQIFREWRNSGLRGHPSNVPHMNNCSRAQWLGENERERVRVVREWAEMTTQQRGTCSGGREEQAAEIGSQIERVRNGLVVDHYEIGPPRAIRRLCGRQALIDLLMRAERERKRELEALLEHRPVSDFSHRNRIQSLLRGRFLRNKIFIQDERPTSLAASELGLLRQRNTVSGLREGFLSRVDNFDRGPLGSDQSDTSSSDDINGHRNEQTQANILQEVLDEICDPYESTSEEEDISVFRTGDLERETGGRINQQESTAHIEEREEQVMEIEDREISSNVEFIERRDSNGEDVVGNWQGGNGNELSQETLDIEGSGQVFREHDDPGGEERDVDRESGHVDRVEGNIVEDFNWQDLSTQVEEWQESATENRESDWQQLATVEFSEWRDSTGEGTDGNSQETSHQWYQEISGNDDIEHSHLQEVAEVEMIDTSYFPDDDNGYNLELRELLSRRRVSNLLRSGFRESLDQLIQSYVQRQGHASVEHELDQDQEQQSGDQNAGESDSVERTPLVLPSPQVNSPTLWEQDLHDANWQLPNSHQRLGIDWEIINYLRIDMARLQQRMDNMQRMLEACMDMQLELQRSVQQEVSAALNRSSGSEESCEDSLPKDESKWDHVRKGICCICCDSNIDSLLYRCGHMCTCSKCADNLVEDRGKCPMCRAPVVEVIRAYSI